MQIVLHTQKNAMPYPSCKNTLIYIMNNHSKGFFFCVKTEQDVSINCTQFGHHVAAGQHLIKSTSDSLWNALMGLVLGRTEVTDLYLSLRSAQACSIGIHLSVHAMFPKSECFQLDRLQGIWQICLEGFKCVITFITKVFLHNPPEELNIIEFTMKFWQEDAKVASCFNSFLHKRFLLLEIILTFKNLLIATVSLFSIALALILAPQLALVKATLNNHCLDAFWLI